MTITSFAVDRLRGVACDQRATGMQRLEDRSQASLRYGTLQPLRELPRPLGKGIFSSPDFEPVATIDRLDVEHFAPRDPKDTPDRGRHILMHAVRELDDDNGALPRCSDQPTGHCA
jgi:hypothetical protein